MKKIITITAIATCMALISVSFYSFRSTITKDEAVGTCSGGKNCRACKNCKYCKHCAKEGGTCSVCK